MYSTHNVIALKKKQDNNYGRTTVPDGGKERRLNAANQYTLLLHSIVVNDNLMHFFFAAFGLLHKRHYVALAAFGLLHKRHHVASCNVFVVYLSPICFCHLVRKLAASRESNVNSVHVILPR